MTSAAAPPHRIDPAGRTALLFMLGFLLAHADKQIMGLLAVPVQNEFALSDSQLGLLQGFSFAVAYAVGGLPIARLLDGGHRVRIAAACVALWSLATMACGLADSFIALLLLRAATAFAEAGLPPAAFSIFSQLPDRRMIERRTNTFMLAPFLGGGLVLVLGGLLLRVLTDSGFTIPGWDAPWRIVFLAAGVPGLIIAPLLALYGVEPPRPKTADPVRPLPSLPQILSAIFVRSRFLRFYYLGLTAFTITVFAAGAWYPVFLVREFGISPAAAGGYAGTAFLVAGVAGTFGARWLAAIRETSTASLLGTYLVTILLLIPVVVGMTIVDDMWVSLALFSVYAFLSAGVLSSMSVPIQLSVPNAMQARSIAVFSLITSALAGSAGPLIVGLLSDRASLSLAAALASTNGVAATLAGALLFRASVAARLDGTVFDEQTPLAPAIQS